MIARVAPVAFTAALLAVTGAGCGSRGAAPPSAPGFERVHFRATDGVRLDGRLYGRGRAGVALVHMGRGGDSQLDWQQFARLLAAKGYLVLTYNRRGICARTAGGCSGGVDDYASSWRDVVGAFRFLERKHVARTVVIGASIGAMSSLYAASEGLIEPAGLVEFGGINHASGYDFDRAQIRRIGGRKLFLSSREDIYGGGRAAREWYAWASPPKSLELLPGSVHGTDLLRPDNAQHKRVEKLLLDFVEQVSG